MYEHEVERFIRNILNSVRYDQDREVYTLEDMEETQEEITKFFLFNENLLRRQIYRKTIITLIIVILVYTFFGPWISIGFLCLCFLI